MVKITISKENANYNSTQPPSYYKYEDYEIATGNIDDYYIYQRMGKGKYSEVFEGRYNKYRVVIKVLKPVRESKINREILILKNLSHKNIIKLDDVVYDHDSETHSLIFNYIEHQDTITLFENIKYDDIICYSQQILEALRYCHSKGIMHRDIKPQNMVISHATKQLKIIDWGLAEFYHPKQEYSVRVASRFYKSPELLLNYPYYDYSLDIWSFGCVLAEMVFRKRPFFYGESNNDQLTKIANILGYTDLHAYIKKYEIMPTKFCDGEGCRTHLLSLVESTKMHSYYDIVDLMEKVLVYDHQERLTASECLEHLVYKKVKSEN